MIEPTRRSVNDFPDYSVDMEGNVYRNGHALKQGFTGRGYRTINLSKPGRSERRLVHRVVLEAFVGIRPAGYHGCHYDGNKENNRLDNLAWLTPAENESHKILHGTQAIGSRNGAHRLTDEQVIAIRRAKAKGGRYWGAMKTAQQYGVAVSTVIRAAAGVHWSHIQKEVP